MNKNNKSDILEALMKVAIRTNVLFCGIGLVGAVVKALTELKEDK